MDILRSSSPLGHTIHQVQREGPDLPPRYLQPHREQHPTLFVDVPRQQAPYFLPGSGPVGGEARADDDHPIAGASDGSQPDDMAEAAGCAGFARSENISAGRSSAQETVDAPIASTEGHCESIWVQLLGAP